MPLLSKFIKKDSPQRLVEPASQPTSVSNLKPGSKKLSGFTRHSQPRPGQAPQKPSSPSPQIRPQAQYKSPTKKVSPQATISPQLEQIQAKAREIILSAKDEAIQIRDQAIKDAKERLEELKKYQISLTSRQEDLNHQENKLKEFQSDLDSLKEQLKTTEKKLAKKSKELTTKLEKSSSLSREEAKTLLLAETKKSIQAQMAKLIKDLEDEARDKAEEQAQEILIDAMRLGATDYVAEYTVSTVNLPSEDIKAKIIGKEGRNIRAFENKSGVDVDMDETPGTIRLSSFDSARREVAHLALTRLIKDGRIQPARIEEYLEKAKKEVDTVMYRAGEKLCHDVGVYNLPRDLIAILGRFKFRSSYGQNMIAHTLEETRIGIRLAQELKANVDVVRLGCLLHDIGKVVDDTEGSHVELGVKLLKQYKLSQPVVDAVAQHHEDEEFSSNESVLVYIADAISGARPGARRENYEEYIKRLQSLEEIAKQYEEVDEAFAIQAGRELRIIVNPKKADDARLTVLASEIRDKIQESLTYPGTVKVNVIRETRVSEVAK